MSGNAKQISVMFIGGRMDGRCLSLEHPLIPIYRVPKEMINPVYPPLPGETAPIPEAYDEYKLTLMMENSADIYLYVLYGIEDPMQYVLSNYKTQTR